MTFQKPPCPTCKHVDCGFDCDCEDAWHFDDVVPRLVTSWIVRFKKRTRFTGVIVQAPSAFEAILDAKVPDKYEGHEWASVSQCDNLARMHVRAVGRFRNANDLKEVDTTPEEAKVTPRNLTGKPQQTLLVVSDGDRAVNLARRMDAVTSSNLSEEHKGVILDLLYGKRLVVTLGGALRFQAISKRFGFEGSAMQNGTGDDGRPRYILEAIGHRMPFVSTNESTAGEIESDDIPF